MSRKLAAVPLLALVFAVAGCPSEQSVSCPSGTSSIGQFTLTFGGQHPQGECVATSLDGGDGGFLGPLALADGGQSEGNICFRETNDGGQVTLVLAGKNNRESPLLDGGFVFQGGTASATNGTACLCPVDIAEVFSGVLVPPDPAAGFARLADGGIPFPVAINGTLQDTLSAADAGDPTCACAMPCTVTYGVAGSL
ncbi:MAG TPA: hypothetical protein VGH20_17640 [Myxococcales bacterium]|jgi:hypothetical protein